MNSFVKKLIIFLVVMGVVGGGGWYGRKLYKKATERRLVAEARDRLQKKDYRNAGLCLQRALQVNPMSVPACVLMGDMLEAVGAPAALTWRSRAARLETNDLSHRFAWAGSALRLQDPRSADEALNGLDEKSKTTVEYHKLAGALAWSQRSPALAEKHYLEALRLDPTNQASMMNLATIHLASTNQAAAADARLELEKVPVNSVLRITALRYLLTDAMNHEEFKRAVHFSTELVGNTNALFVDKVAHMQALTAAKAPELPAFRANLENESKGHPGQAYSFGRWLAQSEGPAKALAWLQSLAPSIQTNQPAPLVVADCQIAVRDWQGLLALVEKKDWGDAEYFRWALESMAQRGLGNELLAKNTWRKSVRTASDRLDSMARLVQVTAAWGWRVEGLDLLREIVVKHPGERWAADQLLNELHAEGNTKALAELLTTLHASNPKDVRIKNNLATIYLLRGSNLENGHRLAKEAYKSAPDNPFYAASYAYSLLLQRKNDEAVKIFAAVKPDYLKIPAVAAYYGVVQAGAGNKNLALEPLRIADQAPILPEEKEIVRLAKASM